MLQGLGLITPRFSGALAQVDDLPANPLSPYATGAAITALVRDLCNDQQAQLFDDTYCVQAVNSGARYIARELRNRGKMTLIADEFKVTIPAIVAPDASQQVYLGYAGVSGNVVPSNNPALPPNFLEPLLLSERPAGENCKFTPMHNCTESGGLLKALQGSRLEEWEWRQDMICFRGATEAADIIIRFTEVPNVFAIVNGVISGSLNDVDALDCCAYYAASQLLPKRGGTALGETYRAEANALLEQLATSTSRSEQFAPVRPRPYGGKAGRGGWPRNL